MKESEIREKLRDGWIRTIVTFEVAGKPKQHVEDSLDLYIENLKKDERIYILQEDREEAIKHDDGIFSTFSECEMLVKNLETFTWICINFSPASIEILEPDDLQMESREVTNWLNDLLAKVHDIATDYRTQSGSKDHLVVAMNQLITNAILLSLRNGQKTGSDLQADTGINADQLQPFLEHLMKKERIKEKKGSYSLA